MKMQNGFNFVSGGQVLNVVAYETMTFPFFWRKTIQHTEYRDWFILHGITEGTTSFF